MKATTFKKVNLCGVEEATHITHAGIFHADEVMATAILSAVEENPIALCRAFRVPEDVDEDAVLVYDTGGGRYDHHQKGGNGSRENGVPYSSCGLIWRAFGRQITTDEAWSLVDRDLIAGIDAVDCGAYPAVDYAAKAASISSLISGFNPEWDSERNADEAFLEAVEFAQGILARAIETAEAAARAKALVEGAILASEGRIIILPRFAPWQDYILASAEPQAAEALYVVFPALRGGYNVQAVPDDSGSFGNRKPFPESWRGLPASDLQTESGVADATFCHPAGFIAGAGSLDGALALARVAVEA